MASGTSAVLGGVVDTAAVTARTLVTGCPALTLGPPGVSVPVTGMLVGNGEASGGVPS
jgi:hypothetical protein